MSDTDTSSDAQLLGWELPRHISPWKSQALKELLSHYAAEQLEM